MPEKDPSVPPGRNAALLRSFVPSLLILVGVFFFISSACFSDGSDDYDPYQPCPVAHETAAPPNAFARVVEPQIDQVFSTPVVDGRVAVPVRLRAGVVSIEPATTCQRDTGHFMLFVERIAGEGCVDPSALQPIGLFNGETETNLLLPPGSYALKAQVFTGAYEPYRPEISATVHFVVEGPPPSFDGGICL